MSYNIVEIQYYETHGNGYAEAGAILEDEHGNNVEADITLTWDGEWSLYEVHHIYP